MKNLKKILAVWMETWQQSNRKVVFPRITCDALRDLGTSAYELQSYISVAMATKDSMRNKPQSEALTTYISIKKECEMAIAEDVASSAPGSIFLLKATHGYEDKQTVRVEDGSLADVIAKKSEHRDN